MEKPTEEKAKDPKKTESENRFEKILPIISICILCLMLFVMIWKIHTLYETGAVSLEHAIKDAKGEREEFYSSKVINKTRGVGFINYDCTPVNKITKGIKDCKGQYFLFADRISNKWRVDNSTKTIIW